LIHGLMA